MNGRRYEHITTLDSSEAIQFHIKTKRGIAAGLFIPEKNRIFVHGIDGDNCMKGILNILINKFKTNKITFTPLINDNIRNSVKGNIKVCEADDTRNPYGERFEYMECVWEC